MNGTKHLDNPSLPGKRHHEMTEHAHMRRSTIKNYLVCALVVINAWSVFGNVRASGTARYVPYPIEVREDGSVRKVGAVDPMWKPANEIVRNQIRTFIITIRGRYDSLKLTGDFWNTAAFHTKDKGRTLFQQTFTDAKLHLFKGTIDVSKPTVLRMNETMYRANWTETKRDANGAVESITRWGGIFTVGLKLPANEQEKENNPECVWFDWWNISEDN